MNKYVLLAKTAVEKFIKEKKVILPPAGLPEDLLKKKAGTFVTIEKEGELRGCIGTYLPTKENMAQEIIQNAIAAATEDYRFNPIQEKELPLLSFSVYILGKSEQIKEIAELDAEKFGIIVKTAPIDNTTDVAFDGHMPSRSGLLLPNLPGVDSVEKQFLIACQKGGIDPAKEKILIYRFTVEKYE